MDSMDTRRKQIVELVNRLGYVRFIQIKENFPNVSEMTLRTDLKALDQEKKIVRIHGGAKSVQLVIGTDDYLNNRSIRNQDEKEEIALEASGARNVSTWGLLHNGRSTAFVRRRG